MKSRKTPVNLKNPDDSAEGRKRAQEIKEREENLKRKFAFLNDKEKPKGVGCKSCGEVGHLSFQCMNQIAVSKPKTSTNIKAEKLALEKKLEALKSMSKKIKKPIK